MRFATALRFTDQSACLCAVMHRLSVVMRKARLSARLGVPFLTMIALLLYHCVYSYKLIFKLKDPTETPMAQHVCSRMFL